MLHAQSSHTNSNLGRRQMKPPFDDTKEEIDQLRDNMSTHFQSFQTQQIQREEAFLRDIAALEDDLKQRLTSLYSREELKQVDTAYLSLMKKIRDIKDEWANDSKRVELRSNIQSLVESHEMLEKEANRQKASREDPNGEFMMALQNLRAELGQKPWTPGLDDEN
jgi:hypothetical protein